MRRLVGAIAVCAVTAVVLFVFGPRVAAQGRGRGVVTDGAFGASFGVSVRDLQGEEATKAPASNGGVYVESVTEGSPAARAGLKAGDIVTEFDGERVRSALHFTRLVRETVAGRAVKATIVRDGSRQTLDITPEEGRLRLPPLPDINREVERGLRNLPRNFSFDFDFDRFPNGVFLTRGRLGATVMSMTDQLADYFGVKQGLLVTTVTPDSPAARAGLKAGDVITAINGRALDAMSDLNSALRDLPADGKVELRVMRDRKELTLNTTLPERDRDRSRDRVRRDRDRTPV